MAGKLKRTNLSMEAYDAVRALLLAGDRYAPGDKISVEELTRELGVSRSPVWAAIARLEVEGLVTVAPRQGVFLTSSDSAGLNELFEAREALEGMAARLAATRATPADLNDLETALAGQRDAMSRGDATAYSDAALVFHRIVLRIAGNGTIARLLQGMHDRTRVLCRGRAGAMPDFIRRYEEHARFVAAVRARDPDRAEQDARAHIRTLAAEAEETGRP